jgi:glycyl-tRNA synthetase beta chain
MKPFLLEIGCEELPSRFIRPAKDGLAKALKDGLAGLRIGCGQVRAFGTPRRLAVLIDDVAEKQQESVTIKFGPPADRAFDSQGKPLPPATGFARAQGVDVSELKVRRKDAADLICVEKVEKGSPTVEVLAGFLPDAIARIPFRKKMRWAPLPVRRPYCHHGHLPLPGADEVGLRHRGRRGADAGDKGRDTQD